MAATTVGSRIVVKGSAGSLRLRALRAVKIEGAWAVPVMADLAAMRAAGIQPGPVCAQIATDQGTLSMDAEIVCTAGVFAVRAPGVRPAALTEQRRENVRAAVTLAVRGTVLSAGQPVSRGERVTPGAAARSTPVAATPADVVLEGDTQTVSAGGLCVRFDDVQDLPKSVRLYLELTMPGGELAPAIVTLIDQQPVTGGLLARVRFADISPLDSERLVRMVFARQRADLAQRRTTVRPL